MSATLTFHHYLPHIAANPFDRDTPGLTAVARQKPGTTILQLRECHLFNGVVSYVPEAAQVASDPSCSARNYAPENGPPLFSVRAAVAQPARGRIGAPIRLEDMFLEHDAIVKFKIGALKIAAPITFQTDSHFIETNYAEHVELGDSDAHLVLRYSGRGYQPEYVRLDVPIDLVEMADPAEGERIRQRSQEALMAREMVALQIGASFSGFKTRAKSAASKVKRPSMTKMKARTKSFRGRLSRSRSRSKSSSPKGSLSSRVKGKFSRSRSRSPSSGSSGSSKSSFKSRASGARDRVKSKFSRSKSASPTSSTASSSSKGSMKDRVKSRFARKPAQSGYKVDKKTGLTAQQTRGRQRAAASGTTGRSPSPSELAGKTRPSSPPPAAPKSGSSGTGRPAPPGQTGTTRPAAPPSSAPKSGSTGTGRPQSGSDQSGKTRPSSPPPAAPKGGARSQSPSEQAGKTRPSAPPPAAPKSGSTGTGRPQPPSSPPPSAPGSRSQSPSERAGKTKPSGPLPQTPAARSQSPSERAGMTKPTRPLPQTPASTSKPTGTTSTASQGAAAAKPSTAAAAATAAKTDRRQGAKDAVKSQKERADRAGAQGQGSQRQQAMAAVDKASPGSLGGGGGGGGGMPSIGGGGGGGGGDNMGAPTGDDGSGGLPPGQAQPQQQAVPYNQQPTMLYDTPDAAVRRAPVPYAQLPPAYAYANPATRPPAVPTLIPSRPSALSSQQLDQVALQLAAFAADDAAATPPNIPLSADYWAARKARAEAALKLIDETSGSWPPTGLARLSPPTAAGQTAYWRSVNQYSMQKLAEGEPPIARELRTHLVNGYFAAHPRVHQISAAIDRIALSPDAERINCYVRDIGNVLAVHN